MTKQPPVPFHRAEAPKDQTIPPGFGKHTDVRKENTLRCVH